MEKEIRYFKVIDGIECRTIEEDNKRYITGYAALYNQESRLLFENGRLFTEILEGGAFDEVLLSSDLDVIYNYNHNDEKLIARNSSGTLNLISDDKGLFFRAEIPNVSYANDLYTLVQRGDLASNSFAFQVDKEDQKWEKAQDGNYIRKISKVKRLFDVSTVNRPAYPNTSVAARNLEELDSNESKIAEELKAIEEEKKRKKQLEKDILDGRASILKIKYKY